MKIPEEGVLLRIFVGESDRVGGRPLYEAIVIKAKELGLAGATVTRGLMGYGATSRMHSAKILRLSEDMPVIIEVVDRREKIEEIMPFLDEHVKEGLITSERVTVVKYRCSSVEKRGC